MLSIKSKTYNNCEDVDVDLKLEDGRYLGSGIRFEDLEALPFSTTISIPLVRQSAYISSQDGRLLPTEIETIGLVTLNINDAGTGDALAAGQVA